MPVLVLHDSTQILAWLAGAALADVNTHIANGYPDLQSDWQAGTLTAELLVVAAGDEYLADLYQVVNGQLTKV